MEAFPPGNTASHEGSAATCRAVDVSESVNLDALIVHFLHRLIDVLAQLSIAEAPGGDEVLTVAEAAELLRVGQAVIYDSISSGTLPHLRIGSRGKHIRLSRSAIMRCLGSCGQQVAKKGQ